MQELDSQRGEGGGGFVGIRQFTLKLKCSFSQSELNKLIQCKCNS